MRCVEGLKVNAGKSNMMVLNGGEELEYEVHLVRIYLQHVSEFKYLGCVLGELGTDEVVSSEGGK